MKNTLRIAATLLLLCLIGGAFAACTKTLSAEEKAAAKEICGGADKAYTVTGVMSISINDEVTDEEFTVKVIGKDGKWYMLG